MTNRRAHIRYDLNKDIEYTSTHAASGESFKGIIVDISDSGLGLFAFAPLSVGQEITIKRGLPHSHSRGFVRWCKELDENIYRVGLLFCNGYRSSACKQETRTSNPRGS